MNTYKAIHIAQTPEGEFTKDGKVIKYEGGLRVFYVDSDDLTRVDYFRITAKDLSDTIKAPKVGDILNLQFKKPFKKGDNPITVYGGIVNQIHNQI